MSENRILLDWKIAKILILNTVSFRPNNDQIDFHDLRRLIRILFIKYNNFLETYDSKLIYRFVMKNLIRVFFKFEKGLFYDNIFLPFAVWIFNLVEDYQEKLETCWHGANRKKRRYF